jgi:hypothetical protein
MKIDASSPRGNGAGDQEQLRLAESVVARVGVVRAACRTEFPGARLDDQHHIPDWREVTGTRLSRWLACSLPAI